MIGVDQQARRLYGATSLRYGSQSGSVAMSRTMTRSFLNAAVPHEPAIGPMHRPSISLQYSIGRFGAAPWRSVMPSSSSSRTEPRMPSAATRSISTTSESSASRSMARDVASESSAAGSSPSSAKKLPVARRGAARSAYGIECCPVRESDGMPASRAGSVAEPSRAWSCDSLCMEQHQSGGGGRRRRRTNRRRAGAKSRVRQRAAGRVLGRPPVVRS